VGGIEIFNADSRIWLLRYPERFVADDFVELFAQARALNPDRYKHAVLVDFRRTSAFSTTPAMRQEAAQALEDNMDFLRETTVAEARVTPNPLTRGMLTVFDWLSPKPWRINNLVSGPTAELWLRGQLERAGIEVPADSVWIE
jgi:hypothetical protein